MVKVACKVCGESVETTGGVVNRHGTLSGGMCSGSGGTVSSLIAPYPDTESESVTEYNNKHYGKAWRIVGMAWQGDVYCTRPLCAGAWPTYESDLVESPHPVFASDEYEAMTCGECGGDLF